MNFMELYTTFDGRINRKPYWIASLLLAAVLLILSLVIGTFLIGTGGTPGAVLQLIFVAIVAYPATALMIKRLHDRDRPGIFAAIFWTPSILQILGQLLGITGETTTLNGQDVHVPNTLGWIILALVLVIGIWALIELGILRGTKGPNQYGPDPLE